MPNRTEARPAKAALTNATGRLPLLRLFSTPPIDPWSMSHSACSCREKAAFANCPKAHSLSTVKRATETIMSPTNGASLWHKARTV
jgi:hypothetical protein